MDILLLQMSPWTTFQVRLMLKVYFRFMIQVPTAYCTLLSGMNCEYNVVV